MKAVSLAPLRLLQNSKFCLFGIAVGLTVLHLSLTWRMFGDIDRLIFDVLFWGSILCFLWRKRSIINLESDIFSSFIGFLLIALVLLKSISLFLFETSSLKVLPLMTVLGLSLLASGIKGLKQYRQELIIVLVLCIPESLLTQRINELLHVTTLTTKFAVFFLWYIGFEVSRQGDNVILPAGSALVSTACTGISTALLLLKLSVLFILFFSTSWSKKVLVLIGAIVIAFVIGGIRVALIATTVSNQEAFNYWHGLEGNQIFSTISILIFGLFCRLLLPPDDTKLRPVVQTIAGGEEVQGCRGR